MSCVVPNNNLVKNVRLRVNNTGGVQKSFYYKLINERIANICLIHHRYSRLSCCIILQRLRAYNCINHFLEEKHLFINHYSYLFCIQLFISMKNYCKNQNIHETRSR